MSDPGHTTNIIVASMDALARVFWLLILACLLHSLTVICSRASEEFWTDEDVVTQGSEAEFRPANDLPVPGPDFELLVIDRELTNSLTLSPFSKKIAAEASKSNCFLSASDQTKKAYQERKTLQRQAFARPKRCRKNLNGLLGECGWDDPKKTADRSDEPPRKIQKLSERPESKEEENNVEQRGTEDLIEAVTKPPYTQVAPGDEQPPLGPKGIWRF